MVSHQVNDLIKQTDDAAQAKKASDEGHSSLRRVTFCEQDLFFFLVDGISVSARPMASQPMGGEVRCSVCMHPPESRPACRVQQQRGPFLI